MRVTLKHKSSFSLGSETITDKKGFRKDSNYILSTRAKEYYGESCPRHLSIKSPFIGEALFETHNGRYRTNGSSYLLINPDQPYSLTVTSESDVQGIIIYISPDFAEDVYRSMTAPAKSLLDDPFAPQATGRLRFIQRLYSHGDIVGSALKALWNSRHPAKIEGVLYEEHLNVLMHRLIQLHHNIRQDINSIPAVHAATREELYRRIYRARDYIESSLDQPLSLEKMARIACLSPNHFMRVFRQVFQATPYQYLTSLRLNRAKTLLRDTDLPITEICFEVGFESLGSFSWLFHRRIGVPPQTFRNQSK